MPAAPVQLPPLTEEQAEAVATDEDVTLVLAGAGTGKTAVILAKVAHLVRNVGVSPTDILVLAYNRNAAAEIRNRLPGKLAETDVSTIHAFGYRVIAKSGVASHHFKAGLGRLGASGRASSHSGRALAGSQDRGGGYRVPGQQQRPLSFTLRFRLAHQSTTSMCTTPSSAR